MTDQITKYEINCDMGEAFGRWKKWWVSHSGMVEFIAIQRCQLMWSSRKQGPDDELIKYIDAASIACGFHAGDPSIMIKTVRLAKAHGVKVGAHPGLNDLFGFGRRQMKIDPADMYAMILYQVGSLKGMLMAQDMELNHIKPHGELFFYMQWDLVICRAGAVLEACVVFKVPVYGGKGANDEKAICEELGIPFIEEAYVDIEYTKEMKQVPIGEIPKLPTAEDIYARTTMVARTDHTVDIEGAKLKMGFGDKPFTVCIHSDMPTALENMKACRKAVNELNAKKYSTAS